MATVRAQALDGRWETFGADRARGVWPEALRATADDWGPATCSFIARRDPGAIYPDLSPATPIDAQMAGRLGFGGYVWEPPQQADERAIAVECRGWQYHLDDDLVDRLYVHSRLQEWADTRQSLATALSVWQASGFVAAGEGQVVFGWEQGGQANAGQHVGVTLDLGPTLAAKRVVVETQRVGSSAAFTFVVRGHDSGDPNPSAGDFTAGFAQDVVAVGHELLSDGFRSGTFTNPHRFITIFMYRDDGASGASGADFLVQLRQVLLFGATAYESGNASILKASDVVKDLLPYAPLLDQRTDLIQTSDVVLPDFVLTDATPRQGMEQANAPQGWQLRVTPERMLEYRPRPTVPIFRVGGWGGSTVRNLSRGSLEPIINRAVVKGNDSSGGLVVVERWAAQQPGVTSERVSTPAFSNPSFDVDTSGWTGVTRDTVVFDSAPAAGRIAGSSTASVASTGTWTRGVMYRLRLRLRGGANGFPLTVVLGPLGDRAVVRVTTPGVFTVVELAWLPRTDQLAPTLAITNPFNVAAYVDSIDPVEVLRPSIPDRRGFIRARGIRVERAIDTTVGTTLADASLRAAMRTPFKGELPVIGRGGLRRFLGDAGVPPVELLRNAGELVHVSNLVDPDSGNLGRDGRLVAVAYDDEAQAAEPTLDSTRTDFETQMARYEQTGR